MQENFIINFSPKVQFCYYDKLKIEASKTHECTQNCEWDLSSQAKSTEWHKHFPKVPVSNRVKIVKATCT